MSFVLLGILNSQAAAGGAGAYQLIQTIEVSNNTTSSVSFTGINPNAFQHLQLRISSAYNAGTFNRDLFITFNNDTSSSYNYNQLKSNGSALEATAASGAQNNIKLLAMPDEAGYFGYAILDITDYANTNKWKQLHATSGSVSRGANDFNFEISSGLYASTNAINAITISASSTNYEPFSRFSLYGIEGS